MAVLLLTYDLNKKDRDYNKLYELRDKYARARLSESSYALDTTETPSQVYEKFRTVLDENDYLYIIPLRKPYMGFGLKEVNAWLDARLTL